MVCDGNGTIRLIVGLGNPGSEYQDSRHNTGFMVIDKLLATFPAGRFTRRDCCRSEVYQGKYRGRELWLQKPMTYMNLSGEAVAPLAVGSRIAPENILVIVDDLDLPLGRLRLRRSGSSGGHNGLNSIIEHLGSRNFNRLRVGIGRAAVRNQANYVLSGFSGEEKEQFENVLDTAVKAINMILKSGMSAAMNEFNAAPESVEKSETANNL